MARGIGLEGARTNNNNTISFNSYPDVALIISTKRTSDCMIDILLIINGFVNGIFVKRKGIFLRVVLKCFFGRRKGGSFNSTNQGDSKG